MKQLKSLAKAGKGKVAAIMPDTVSSTRYVEFDQPDIKKALLAAGLSSSNIIIQNALGSDATQYTDAQTDITNGATVLLIDPFDSGVGKEIETYAHTRGVDVIDYDRLTLGGSAEYYVSFNNVQVGTLIGQGLVSCISAWKIAKPQVVVMHGAATDNNATQFAQGYDAVLKPYFKSGKYVDVANTADTWDPPTAETEFQEAYTAHPNINAALIPNDETGSPIISYLQSQHVAPKKFPTTGQDATATGLDDVLTGYQCGTVYKPIFIEASAASAIAIYLRAGKKPPSSLVNGTTVDPTSNRKVTSSLLIPEWVTTKNMNSTVIADNFVPASQLCVAPFAAACTAAGITP
jgi:D-xylose transport system substrate-binding protein